MACAYVCTHVRVRAQHTHTHTFLEKNENKILIKHFLDSCTICLLSKCKRHKRQCHLPKSSHLNVWMGALCTSCPSSICKDSAPPDSINSGWKYLKKGCICAKHTWTSWVIIPRETQCWAYSHSTYIALGIISDWETVLSV